MDGRVHVEFNVKNREAFLLWLQRVTEADDQHVIGYRADDIVQRREALTKFVNEMESVLRKNDSKKTWREKPIEALMRLLVLEVEELKVAMEFFSAAEAQHECVDVANFAMMVFDRLSMLSKDQHVKAQLVAAAS